MLRQPPVRTRTIDGRPTRGATTPPPSVEIQLAHLEDQLDALRTQVRQAQQLASLGTAAAMIAHEVNNLLTPLRSYAQYALETQDPELQQKALAVTLNNVALLVSMSERVLQIGAPRTTQARSGVLLDIVQAARQSLCRDLAKDGITFVCDVASELTAWVDPLQLQQVLFNLFLNARKAMAEVHGGRLSVSAERSNDRIELRVRDTGGGISPELLPRVFVAFQTSKTDKGGGHGRCAGLGLALCRDLIEQNQGTIGVESQPGQGTTFTMSLPASPPAETTAP